MVKNLDNEKLKLMLEKIKKLVYEYNSVSDDKLILYTEGVKEDVSNVYIGIYNKSDNKEYYIGLFRKVDWCSNYIAVKNPYNFPIYSYDSGSLYISSDSKFIAVRKNHENIYKVNIWQPMGTEHVINGKTYRCNCDMKEVMKFDDMRQIMYDKNIITIYEPGNASVEEIKETLTYAFEYFELNKGYRKIKK